MRLPATDEADGLLAEFERQGGHRLLERKFDVRSHRPPGLGSGPCKDAT
jgi:hypothetical protein